MNGKTTYIRRVWSSSFIFPLLFFHLFLFVSFSFADDDLLLRKSIEYTLKNYLGAVSSDGAILSKWVSDVYPHDGLQKYVRTAYKTLLKHPDHFNANFLRLLNEKHPLMKPLCGAKLKPDDMDCLLLQSIWCDAVPTGKNFISSLKKALNDAENASSADVTSHVLYAFSELRERKCSASTLADDLLENARQFLLKYLKNSKDGYAEGVAMLLRAGFGGDVQEDWISSIRDTLHKKIAKRCATCGSEPHDILLEIYAVAQWHALGKSEK